MPGRRAGRLCRRAGDRSQHFHDGRMCRSQNYVEATMYGAKVTLVEGPDFRLRGRIWPSEKEKEGMGSDIFHVFLFERTVSASQGKKNHGALPKTCRSSFGWEYSRGGFFYPTRWGVGLIGHAWVGKKAFGEMEENFAGGTPGKASRNDCCAIRGMWRRSPSV